MGKPYSVDLRERAVAAVLKGGLSRRKAAVQFAVAMSTVIDWVKRYEETGRLEPGQMGGHKPKAIRDEHEAFLTKRVREGAFTLRGSGARTRRPRPQGRLPVGVELRSSREAQLQKRIARPVRKGAVLRLAADQSASSIRPRGAACGHDGNTHASVLIKLPASDRAVF